LRGRHAASRFNEIALKVNQQERAPFGEASSWGIHLKVSFRWLPGFDGPSVA
jgi:hypothetical protein